MKNGNEVNQGWNTGRRKLYNVDKPMEHHSTGSNVADFCLGLISIGLATVSKFIAEFSPIIGFVTVCLGCGVAAFTLYNQFHIARKNWKARKR